MSGPKRPGLSGERDQVVTIQQRPTADGQGTSGFPVDTWTTLIDEMPALKEQLSGREKFWAMQNSASVDTRWEINYVLDMDPDLLDVPKLRRLVHNGRVHDIVAASQLGRREGIELRTLAGSRVA